MTQGYARALVLLGAAWLGCSPSGRAAAGAGEGSAALNQLTDEERAEGWILLFDGKTLTEWRGFKKDRPPNSWAVVDGALQFDPSDERGDIITREQYDDFELRLEWKISPNGNSGIFYRASESSDPIWRGAPEMQVLDNTGHPDGGNPLTSAGANYALNGPSADVTRPVGSWNHVRLIVAGSHVEHWLNGEKVVEYELGSPEWKAAVAGSKFNEWPAYGSYQRGHIALQDHGDKVWYRNIKLRRLAG